VWGCPTRRPRWDFDSLSRLEDREELMLAPVQGPLSDADLG
jgi:hypothetical protein